MPNTETLTLRLDVEFDPGTTDREAVADTMNRVLQNALSTDGILDEIGNPNVGDFEEAKLYA